VQALAFWIGCGWHPGGFMSDDRLVLLVKRWIRAEHEFRFGRYRYTKEGADWLMEAEDLLRRAVTKKKDLKDAYEVVKNEQAR